MRIDCDSCGAAYAIDDSLISDRGVRAQCPKCGAQKVVKKGGASTPLGAPPGDAPSPFGGGAPSPFGGPGAAPSPFGGSGASPSPFGGGVPAPGGGPPAPAGGAPSPFGAPPQGSSPFGGAPSPSPFAPAASPPTGAAASPFGAPPSPNPFAPPGTSGGAGSPFPPPAGASPFGAGGGGDPFGAPAPSSTPSPFGSPGAGGPPAGGDPFGAPPGPSPFGAPPATGGGGAPFGAPPSPSPFGAPPTTGGGDPFGGPGGGDPFGSPGGGDPFGGPPKTGGASFGSSGGGDPFGGSSPSGDIGKDADPFADLGTPSAAPSDDPFANLPTGDSGSDEPNAVEWQVKIRGKLETDIPLAQLRSMVRQGKVGPDDEAGPMGKPLTRVADIAVLAVSLPRGTAAPGKAQGARASGGGIPTPLIALVVLVTLGAAGYGVWRFQPDLFSSQPDAGVNPFKRAHSQWSLQFPEVEGTSQEHVVEAKKYMRADTAAGYRKADEHFRMALLLDEGNLDAIAGFVENFSLLPNVRTDADGVALAIDGIDWALRLQPDNADLLRAQGALKLAVGDIDGSQRVLQRVKVLARDDVGAKLLLARTHLDRNVSEALDLVNQVQRADPELKAALQVAGAAHRRLGNFSVAREKLTERLKADPNNVATLKELARLELDLGEGRAALKWLEQLLKAEERDIEAHLMRAKIAYQVLGDLAMAEEQLKFVVDNYEKAAGDLIRDTLAHYAHALAERGKLDEALKVAERGLALDAQYAPIHFVLGRIHTKKGDLEGAKSSFSSAVRLLEVGGDQLYEPVVRSFLADVQAKSGDETNAVRNLTRVLEYAPRYARGYFALAALHMRQRKAAQANTVMRKVLDIDPLHSRERLELSDYPAPDTDLLELADVFANAKVAEDDRSLKLSSEGIIRFHARKAGAAKDLFERALKDDRNNHAALLYMAVLDLQSGRAGLAKKRLVQAQRTTAGTHSITQLYLARAEMQLGDLKKAERRLQDVLENEPTLVQAHFTLGELYVKQKKKDAAVERFRRVVKDAPDYLPVKRTLAALE